MIAFAARLVGARLAPFLVYGVAALLALAALWGWGHSRYRAGVHAERAAWQLREARTKAAQAARERQADQNLEQQRTRDAAAAEQRKQEIDNATRNIPDQSPTARQRARACVELRRQSRAAGRPEPSC